MPIAPARLSADAGRAACDTLHVIFGDQLTDRVRAFADFDDQRDVICMAEVDEESGAGEQPSLPPSHRMRTAVFLSAMRHFAIEQERKGRRVRYIKLDAPGSTHTLAGEIARAAGVLKPRRIRMTHPGEWRVLKMARSLERSLNLPVEIHPDDHFLTPIEEFQSWASKRRALTMEYFYREQRKRTGALMDKGKPIGGAWNFDAENRKTFRAAPAAPAPVSHQPDDITREVIDLVNRRYPHAPGRLSPEGFIWPVTARAASRALDDFITHRLPDFGAYEDAMWTGEPVLFHSLLSVPLNLKLLDPRDCVAKAEAAYHAGAAPLNSVEGFVRQIIGWREFIRGVYWTEGPGYRDRNSLDQHGALPEFFWTGETDMVCMRESLSPVLDHAWSHHIPRLMVISAFCMMAGVHPRAIGDWFFAMYADSVDWVTTPNTIGMAMHCDGRDNLSGVVGTKPYAASGRYIDRMSNFCKRCRYSLDARAGDDACPYNTLFWDFLLRNRERFASNQRMTMMLRNLDRIGTADRVEITISADRLRDRMGIGAIKA